MDAFLLVSYGAPEQKDEVVPFLENLFAGSSVGSSVGNNVGHNAPAERIKAAAGKYYDFSRQTGRFSPLNNECRSLIAGILRELTGTPGQKVPAIYWGNLFWHPRLEDTLDEMTRNGIRKAVCFVTSAFGSQASRERYVEAIESARSKVGPEAPTIEMLPLPFDHPLFLEAQADRLLEALAWTSLDAFATQPMKSPTKSPERPENDAFVFFTAHSILRSDANTSDYETQLTETCRLVAELCGPLPWELAWQSRGGGPSEDWLGPDIKDRITQIASEGRYRSVVVSPIGFFCENMETVRDLDLELGELCEKLKLGFARAQAVGASPKICRMICEMISRSNQSSNP